MDLGLRKRGARGIARCPVPPDEVLGAAVQQLAQGGIRLELHPAQQVDLVLAEQRPGVHVVLHQGIGHHHVAHVHIRMQAARQPAAATLPIRLSAMTHGVPHTVPT
ncbi:hypothetical protein G6F66_015339 [Rhizopus arrhizus]|nr:hypothetical protein G6F66_015339 [Rhizopus arrhizus]